MSLIGWLEGDLKAQGLGFFLTDPLALDVTLGLYDKVPRLFPRPTKIVQSELDDPAVRPGVRSCGYQVGHDNLIVL